MYFIFCIYIPLVQDSCVPGPVAAPQLGLWTAAHPSPRLPPLHHLLESCGASHNTPLLWESIVTHLPLVFSFLRGQNDGCGGSCAVVVPGIFAPPWKMIGMPYVQGQAYATQGAACLVCTGPWYRLVEAERPQQGRVQAVGPLSRACM